VPAAVEDEITLDDTDEPSETVSASSTAEWIATYRAAEAALPGDRSIYRDHDAHLFVTDPKLRVLIGRPRIARAALAFLDFWTPGIAGQAFVRYRFFDELLARMLADGLEQVVILGAGYDATGLRLGRQASSATVYEVDAPETQARKRELLARIDSGVLTRTEFVECDFARDSVAERLREAGLAADEPALFSWLGVTWYLDAPTVESFLADLASIAAPGSRIVFDYMHASALFGPSRPLGARLASRVVALQGEPWTFGRDPDEVDGWLARRGWRVKENVRASEQRERYQRLHQGRLRAAADWVSVVDAVRDDNASAGR
jgi:methyltransferase (TIGR00027 family)